MLLALQLVLSLLFVFLCLYLFEILRLWIIVNGIDGLLSDTHVLGLYQSGGPESVNRAL